MAGTIIEMSKIKQLLHLKKAGVSNRQIAKDLKMSRDKANEYVNRAESDPLGIDGLLQLDDPVLEKRFHPGNPAYTDERMETFLKLLPDFVEQLSHMAQTERAELDNLHLIEQNIKDEVLDNSSLLLSINNFNPICEKQFLDFFE